ncbi:hypothetical protein FBZ85_11664 [Azospirillum brasilense]|uniref:Uncharacterized protein n=1 Tax=Azospirillum baldaniorum TaxID=1064539 RepID=A0A9P1JTA6_9PROT|nr:hypothetical protein FBZ85_11664 [Azospirillum brasilense]CCC99371.1 protein of unknown function [Azospirillum baldaniorum]
MLSLLDIPSGVLAVMIATVEAARMRMEQRR